MTTRALPPTLISSLLSGVPVGGAPSFAASAAEAAPLSDAFRTGPPRALEPPPGGRAAGPPEPTIYQATAARASARAKDGPSGVETLRVTHDAAYAWDYAVQRPELRVLYEKSKDLMWNARTYLPWETEVDPECDILPEHLNPLYGTRIWKLLDPKRDLPRLRHHQAAYTFSNFLHGEQGALLATSQIVAMAQTADAKFYAASQVFDEARHVEAYDRYLREKIQLIYPVSAPLRELLDIILLDTRWDFKFLGMQIMIEGVALGAFAMIEQTSKEPLIKAITQMIMQDESRHVAFGVLSLKDTYRDMSPHELRDREDFVIKSAQMLHDRFLQQEVWERMDLPQAECEACALHSPTMQLFRKLVFSKIVPNAKRLGLLTPYVRKAFAELDILEYETWEPSA